MRIGDYEVQVTRRAACRRMILRYRREEGALLLSAPVRATEAEIRAFLQANMDWIRRTAGQPRQWRPSFAAGERHWCLGRLVTLGTDAPAGESAYLKWRNAQLQRVLQGQLSAWAARMHVVITHVTLQEMTSRWGSCRAKTGRLTFNTKLAMYDPALIEETVVHELCHFYHQNHSAAFYALLTKWLPDWRGRKQRRTALDVRPLPPSTEG